METVAVYAEHPIRVYGLKAEPGLCLVSAESAAGGWSETAAALAKFEGSLQIKYIGTEWEAERVIFRACLPSLQAARLEGVFKEAGLALTGQARKVHLIHLQGPHFGDRYGLAAAALGSLEEAGLEPLAVGGAVHSLFLAVQPADSEATLKALAKNFSDKEPQGG